MDFVVQTIEAQLEALPAGDALVVALSGGLDSMVLLHSVFLLREAGRLQRPLRALHINHGLSPNAGHWQQFCETQCARRSIPIDTAAVTVGTGSERSPEEHARLARYQAFNAKVGGSEWLLLGHHLDDQMETVLLALTRGAGPAGLGGMPRARPLDKGMLLRPLLHCPRVELLQFARSQALPWIDDESNFHSQFDRNFWRQEILPTIDRRFPGYRKSWQKSMALCREASQLCEELAAEDFSRVATGDPRIINAGGVRSLSDARRRNVLRHWMREAGFAPPGWQLMRRLSEELVFSETQGASLECGVGLVRKFNDRLLLMRKSDQFAGEPVNWEFRRLPEFPLPYNGQLVVGDALDQQGNALGLNRLGTQLTVRYGAAGESIRLPGRRRKNLRKLLQSSALPPWLRVRQPLLYAGGELVCIPGIGVVEAFQAGPGEQAVCVNWRPPELLYPMPAGS